MSLTEDNTAKTFVVTGATSGIGLALARALAHTAERLRIVGRNAARLHAATEATGHEERNLEIIPILADLERWRESGHSPSSSTGCRESTSSFTRRESQVLFSGNS